jgi:hypothetical protein
MTTEWRPIEEAPAAWMQEPRAFKIGDYLYWAKCWPHPNGGLGVYVIYYNQKHKDELGRIYPEVFTLLQTDLVPPEASP